MAQNDFLLYGANGYTGELIARFAEQYNLRPILAGRRREAIVALAERLKLPYLVFDLDDQAALLKAMEQVKVVVHAAGPFDHTAQPVIDACLKTGTHYLDLNGDKDVFELLYNYDTKAKAAGIMVLPGAGFDVVPTDCTAFYLKKQLPDATHLTIAFATPGGAISHGTAVTTVAKLGEPGAVRSQGKLVPVPIGHKTKWINFFTGRNKPEKKVFVMTIPWGDIFTAHVSTGIPNIETYTQVPPAAYPIVKMQGLFNWFLKKEFVRDFLKKKLKQRPAGLTDEKREKATTMVWGEVVNKEGKKVTSRLSGPDAYTLTAYSTLLITKKIMEGNFKPGYQTPATAYGENLVLEIPGVERE